MGPRLGIETNFGDQKPIIAHLLAVEALHVSHDPVVFVPAGAGTGLPDVPHCSRGGGSHPERVSGHQCCQNHGLWT